MQHVIDYFVALGPWCWFILAGVLLVLEIMVPGVTFAWFGGAAILVGILAVSVVIAWQWQFVAFAVFALAIVFWVRRYVSQKAAESDEPSLNKRGSQYIGRMVVVENAIVSGRGRVRVEDSLWYAIGPDVPEGTRVKVVGLDGTALVVETLNDP